MAQALELARLAGEAGEVPVGAVLVDAAGEVIGRGRNGSIANSDPTAHAEVAALRDAGQACGNYRFPDSTLYVTVEPCTMCAGALIHARVKTLVFAAPEPKAGAIVSAARVLEADYLNHRVEVVAGVCEDTSAALMRNFFKQRRDRR